MTDIRVSNPTGADLFEALALKPKNKPTQEAAQPVQEKVPQDESSITKEKAGKVPSSSNNIDFSQPKKDEYNAIPLRLTDDGKLSFTEGQPAKFLVDENGYPSADENGTLLVSEKEGKFAYVKADDKGEPILNEKGEAQFVLPPKSKTEEQPQVEAAKVENKEGKTEEEFDLAPILDPNADESLPEDKKIGKFKVDDKGVPVLDQEGKLIPDEKGEPVFAKVKKGVTDENGGMIPLTDDKGNMVYMSQKQVLDAQTPPEIKKVMGAMETHSAQRLLTGLGYKSMAESGVRLASNTLIKGVSFTIPLTKKAIGFGAEHAVAKAVSAQLAKVSKATVKSGTTTIIAATKTATELSTKGAIESLTKSGLLGKGIETLTMKEATKIAGGRVKAIGSAYKTLKGDLAALKAVEKTTEKVISKASAKTAAKTTEKVGVTTMLGVSEKIMVGAGEKALKEGTTKAIEKGIEKAVKRAGGELAEKVTTKTTAELLTKTAEKAATKSAKTGTAVAGKTIAKYGSVISTVANGAILAYDGYDAYKKIKDPNVSTTSKVLAGTTVGLDIAAMALEKKYKPLSWVATGLSIATSVGSDYTKNK